MAQSLFFVPIRGHGNKIVQLADDYCNLGNRVATVIDKTKGAAFIKMKNEPQPMLTIALKIVSYILLLGIPWLIACAIKIHHRYDVKYVFSSSEEKSLPKPTEEKSPPEQSAIQKGQIDDISSSSSSHPMEIAQQQLLGWWNEADELGKKWKNRGKDCPLHPELISTLQTLAKQQEKTCPQKEIVLVCMDFRYTTFEFFYAHMPEGKMHLALSRQVGSLLRRANKQNIELPWLTIDPETGKQVIVRVKKIGDSNVPKAGGSMSAGSYLGGLVNSAQSNKDCEEFRILEALVPYACSVKKLLEDEYYQKLRALINAYPENPHASLS